MATLDALIIGYLSHHRPKLRSHLAHYSSAPDIREAIARASRADFEGPNIKHPHQYRLPKTAITSVFDKLSANELILQDATDFLQLYGIVSKAIGGVPDVGPLMIYDTALRIGAFLKVSPNDVFVQRGALGGAKNFFVHIRKKPRKIKVRYLPSSDFLPELARLSPHEIENFLCVCEDELLLTR
ncbi:hypothetical protein [Pararhodobacter zhoushanensis]|uniref:hypothetical protein n=1 Tax=Pararhodobacter zhoushanensis TaxID=2479545 RepID=UPI000F8F24D1|nr:hypothetical protein [Pararhodobacter zhoushanensis]